MSKAGCYLPNLYISANTSGLESTLGMALIWPQGLEKDLPPWLSHRGTAASYRYLEEALPSP